ncbi:MAG: hypothetical protein K0R66_523 [Gammaproteobacteria bacterium]|jgi:hypothetical protein|nr:hypothetical protein [Gammaproteobacteria bacterium]
MKNRIFITVNAIVALAFAHYVSGKARQPSKSGDQDTQKFIEESAKKRAAIEEQLNQSQGPEQK